MSEQQKTGERQVASGTCKTFGYRVETRTSLSARLVGRQIVSREWSALRVEKGPDGVPPPFDTMAQHMGLHDYDAALALMAWASAASPSSIGLEFRLVKLRLDYSYTLNVVGVGEPRVFFEMERAERFGTAADYRANDDDCAVP